MHVAGGVCLLIFVSTRCNHHSLAGCCQRDLKLGKAAIPVSEPSISQHLFMNLLVLQLGWHEDMDH